MYLNRMFFLMTVVIPLFLLMTVITLITPAMASGKSSRGAGPVTQEQVNTGNSQLDKEINKFYSCISKTHQDPPTKEKIDNCYYQALGGNGNTANFGGSENRQTSAAVPTSTPAGHTHHKHGISGTSSGVTA